MQAKDDLLQVLTGEIRDKDGDLDEARQRLEVCLKYNTVLPSENRVVHRSTACLAAR